MDARCAGKAVPTGSITVPSAAPAPTAPAPAGSRAAAAPCASPSTSPTGEACSALPHAAAWRTWPPACQPPLAFSSPLNALALSTAASSPACLTTSCSWWAAAVPSLGPGPAPSTTLRRRGENEKNCWRSASCGLCACGLRARPSSPAALSPACLGLRSPPPLPALTQLPLPTVHQPHRPLPLGAARRQVHQRRGGSLRSLGAAAAAPGRRQRQQPQGRRRQSDGRQQRRG